MCFQRRCLCALTGKPAKRFGKGFFSGRAHEKRLFGLDKVRGNTKNSFKRVSNVSFDLVWLTWCFVLCDWKMNVRLLSLLEEVSRETWNDSEDSVITKGRYFRGGCK